MTDPETKVLAFQIDGKIRLVWEKEEEPMWLDFEPLTYSNPARINTFDTQTVTVPQDCTLYMDTDPVTYMAYHWIKNDVKTQACGNKMWSNRTLTFVAGDQLSIRGELLMGSGSGTITLYLNDADGDKVAEFDFMYP